MAGPGGPNTDQRTTSFSARYRVGEFFGRIASLSARQRSKLHDADNTWSMYSHALLYVLPPAVADLILIKHLYLTP